MLRQLRKDDRGIVFVTVLMIIITMMILTVSIISLNVTQTVTSSGEIHRIQAEYLALGAIPYFYANQWTSSSSNTITYTQTLDGISFTVVANIIGPGLAGYNTSGLNISVTY
ncbi:MAG: hypothetical protein A3G91_00580 [Omnitrophica WOR_2 bacterium RIFCSPLOWO2_12_FULL_50_9]|nr:MAG: hypothetical protein A3D87_04495 [Omnitrophica WOR_2 bacterium RIFCSPHIGHO2_02_FULL_50_17]OGX42794.1 MAG: hypothetical protein A3G91_00580 [Omnitrophica WOR_2 bacterium RIFCSPLOWO2_12_FULL_50_9]